MMTRLSKKQLSLIAARQARYDDIKKIMDKLDEPAKKSELPTPQNAPDYPKKGYTK